MMHWLAELDGRRVSVEVPASSANLGAGYDCLGLALGILDRIDLEVRGWSPDPIDLVDRRARAPTSCRPTARTASSWASRPSSASTAARSPRASAGGSRCATRSRCRAASARRRPRPSAACWPAMRSSATRSRPATCCASRRRSRATPTTRPPRCWAASSWPPDLDDEPDGPIEALRFDAPRELRAVLFIPELRLSTEQMRAALPATVPLADAVANLARVAIGVAGLATGRHDLLRSADGRPDPRAVPGGRLPAAAVPRGRGPGGRRDRGLPVGGRLDGHRVRRLDDGVLADQGGLRRRRRRPGPARPERDRHAPQPWAPGWSAGAA